LEVRVSKSWPKFGVAGKKKRKKKNTQFVCRFVFSFFSFKKKTLGGQRFLSDHITSQNHLIAGVIKASTEQTSFFLPLTD
jgi:hypothetical protein